MKSNDGDVELPAPFASKSVKNFSVIIGWPSGTAPTAPDGFIVEKYADKLLNPRNLLVGPNGDVFVAEANRELAGVKLLGAEISGYGKAQRIADSARRVSLLRDANHDGHAEITQFLVDQNQPYGLLIKDGFFYVANMDGVTRYPVHRRPDDGRRPGHEDRRAARRWLQRTHWTRNLVARPRGQEALHQRRLGLERVRARRRERGATRRHPRGRVPTARTSASSRAASATRRASHSSPAPASCGRP